MYEVSFLPRDLLNYLKRLIGLITSELSLCCILVSVHLFFELWLKYSFSDRISGGAKKFCQLKELNILWNNIPISPSLLWLNRYYYLKIWGNLKLVWLIYFFATLLILVVYVHDVVFVVYVECIIITINDYKYILHVKTYSFVHCHRKELGLIVICFVNERVKLYKGLCLPQQKYLIDFVEETDMSWIKLTDTLVDQIVVTINI